MIRRRGSGRVGVDEFGFQSSGVLFLCAPNVPPESDFVNSDHAGCHSSVHGAHPVPEEAEAIDEKMGRFQGFGQGGVQSETGLGLTLGDQGGRLTSVLLLTGKGQLPGLLRGVRGEGGRGVGG